MKSRTCPKCGSLHEGQGLSPSVKDKLSICGPCYKKKERARHSNTYVPKKTEFFPRPDSLAPCCEGCGSALMKMREHRPQYARFCGPRCGALYLKNYRANHKYDLQGVEVLGAALVEVDRKGGMD